MGELIAELVLIAGASVEDEYRDVMPGCELWCRCGLPVDQEADVASGAA